MSLAPFAPSQWFNSLRDPLSYGKLYWYKAGTLIAKRLTLTRPRRFCTRTRLFSIPQAVRMSGSSTTRLMTSSYCKAQTGRKINLFWASSSDLDLAADLAPEHSVIHGWRNARSGWGDIWDDGCFV